MLLDSVFLQRSDNGEISLFDERDNFIASFNNGQWFSRLLFQDHELEEFTIIENEEEISRILAEARAALGRPLVETDCVNDA